MCDPLQYKSSSPRSCRDAMHSKHHVLFSVCYLGLLPCHDGGNSDLLQSNASRMTGPLASRVRERRWVRRSVPAARSRLGRRDATAGRAVHVRSGRHPAPAPGIVRPCRVRRGSYPATCLPRAEPNSWGRNAVKTLPAHLRRNGVHGASRDGVRRFTFLFCSGMIEP